jgi:hypothetical protein
LHGCLLYHPPEAAWVTLGPVLGPTPVVVLAPPVPPVVVVPVPVVGPVVVVVVVVPVVVVPVVTVVPGVVVVVPVVVVPVVPVVVVPVVPVVVVVVVWGSFVPLPPPSLEHAPMAVTVTMARAASARRAMLLRISYSVRCR